MLERSGVCAVNFRDVASIVRAAIDLGARRRGGPLSAMESRLAEQAMRRASLPADERRALARKIERGQDPLGDALQELRDQQQRRRRGSFYTPSSMVRPMVAWVLAAKPDVVVDPGCGSGRFAAEVIRRSPELEILAIDNDAVATLLTRAMIAVLGPRRATVEHTDFLGLERLSIGPNRRVGWVGNPPYVRHHLLSRALKERGVALAVEAGHTSFMTAGLHTLFFTKTKLLAKDGDIGCYVTAAEWLANKSGGIVRDLFLNGLGGQSVQVLDAETFAFAGAKTTAAVTCFRVGSRSSRREFSHSVPVDDLRLAGQKLNSSISEATLSEAQGWGRLILNPGAMPDTGHTIGDLFHVHRGTATGANYFFAMTEAEALEHGVQAYGVPTVTRASEIVQAGGVLRRRGVNKIVLSFPKSLDRKRESVVDAYLRKGEKPNDAGSIISEGANARLRSPWWSFALARPAIVATYMGRRPPVFAANPDRLGILNIAIGLEPRFTMSAKQIEEVVAALNSAAASYEEYAVRYFGNLKKFEPRVLAALPLPESLAKHVTNAEPTKKSKKPVA